jgi:DtxR family Mn-dependent transcriptional regulator
LKVYEEKTKAIASNYDEQLINELLSKKYVFIENGEIKLSEEGERVARKVVRLHRLAERLLSDVLGISEHNTEISACLFEHVLSEEVEEAICTLLGHPAICPHGRRIPKGECCLEGASQIRRLIFKLSELNPGDEGEVKYLVADEPVLQKILTLGMLPGKRFRIIRVFPAYVVQLGNTNFAIDKTIADTIYALKI